MTNVTPASQPVVLDATLVGENLPEVPAESKNKTWLKHYQSPAYLVAETALTFEIHPQATKVHSKIDFVRAESTPENAPLVLKGTRLELISVSLNGEVLGPTEYICDEHELIICGVPHAFQLEVVTQIDPSKNKSGLGVYYSGPMICTQMEAEGFRCMSYYPDRPDVMSRYTTTIIADKEQFPVLLSNGNQTAHGVVEGDPSKHFVTYRDPFPKPCYLFAMVAGKLSLVEDCYTTLSGREIKLHFYVEAGKERFCEHAMASLKRAMRWDETEYGFEYELDTYRVVSVADFNMGAMENKGLNIFNDAFVLADPKTATDDDYYSIEKVIGHEYFHDRTGNRITCRDWFQLTLKEGLTVFRDQEFSASTTSPTTERIVSVNSLRSGQFEEDAGPQAHPIRPDSYIDIENFYTDTVYRKGAEVVRMVHTLLGHKTFMKGIEKYFELYDGQAVTTDDFLHSMHLASGYDFSQFKRWYNQAGTPKVSAHGKYEPASKTYTLTFEQSCPSTPGQPEKQNFVIPIKTALLDTSGNHMSLLLNGEAPEHANTERMLVVTESRQQFTFVNIADGAIPSLLRSFSAPIKIDFPWSSSDLSHILTHDSDGFNRYEASQQLALGTLRQIMGQIGAARPCSVSQEHMAAFGRVLADAALDPMLKREIVTPPSISRLVDGMVPIDYAHANKAIRAYLRLMAETFESELLKLYTDLGAELRGEYRHDFQSMGSRSLRSQVLRFLLTLDKPEHKQLAFSQYQDSKVMSDQFSALRRLADYPGNERESALSSFRRQWQDNQLVLQKWFYVQANADDPQVLERVRKLALDPLFDRYNPSTLRALYGGFASNSVWFHDAQGEGYNFLADKIIEIDAYNSSVAASLANSYFAYNLVSPAQQRMMKHELLRILGTPKLSTTTYEIVSKTLGEN